MEYISEFITSGFLPAIMLIIRMIVPVLALYVVWRSYTSFKKGQRRHDPVVMLVDPSTGVRFPVLYWENSIGRSKSCDINLPDSAVSRDHAVLMRRDEGWMICDTGSKSGVFVNGRKISGPKKVNIGDTVTIGATTLSLWNSDKKEAGGSKSFKGFSSRAASPAKLMAVASLVHLLVALQGCFSGGEFSPIQLVPFAAVLIMGWGLYIFSIHVLNRVSFEIETVAYMLSGIGISLLAAFDIDGIMTQIAAMLIGICLFCFLIWFMGDLDRVAKARIYIGIGAIALLALNLLIGTESYGSKNWIQIGPVSFQPSELVKIAFIFMGASTLDRLQTKQNLTSFIIFSILCMGSLFIMRDFGTAVIFFACFLIIAFMRSGSIRTIALILAGACIGVVLILYFRPYVAQRFMGWGHVWEYVNESLGYQQVRTLTYIASGGLFGIGLGDGCLSDIFAADSDLVFGMLCEEQGLILALVVLAALALFIFYARSEVTRSRSTFFSIAACAAAGMLLFQTCLNVFGPTDILPLTGVTLPFISSGGSSMISVWCLMAFLKASDERTYAARRALKSSSGGPQNRTRAQGKYSAPRGRMEDIYS